MKYILLFFNLLFCFQAEAAISTNYPKNTRTTIEKHQNVLRNKKNKRRLLSNLFKKKIKYKNPKKKELPNPVKVALLALPISIAIGFLFNPIAFLIGGIVFFAGLIIGIRMAKRHPGKYDASLAKALLWTVGAVVAFFTALLIALSLSID